MLTVLRRGRGGGQSSSSSRVTPGVRGRQRHELGLGHWLGDHQRARGEKNGSVRGSS